MNNSNLKIKLSFITGLRKVVLHEINRHALLHISTEDADSLYLNFTQNLTTIKSLRGVARAYVIAQDYKYNPSYISNHKAILSNMIDTVLTENKNLFKSFKITCAGANSPEVQDMTEYTQEKYGLTRKDKADLKIHIIKINGTWEIGIQITPRPLSFREYKSKNMSGAMDPTIAFAVNSFCKLENANSYLNIFSGSATLLLEAMQCYPNIKHLIGFDNNKKHLSLAIQNIKKAGLLKRIQLKEENIFDNPELGTFDAITSDLPFGMAVSKNENIKALYQHFIDYCQKTLHAKGRLVIYTSEHETLKEIILKSKFKIISTVDLKLITSVNAYLHPKIFVCKFK